MERTVTFIFYTRRGKEHSRVRLNRTEAQLLKAKLHQAFRRQAKQVEVYDKRTGKRLLHLDLKKTAAFYLILP